MNKSTYLAVFTLALSPIWVDANDARSKDNSNVAAAGMTGAETAMQSTKMQEKMFTYARTDA